MKEQLAKKDVELAKLENEKDLMESNLKTKYEILLQAEKEENERLKDFKLKPVSFITFCVLFGIVLALIREDTWNR